MKKIYILAIFSIIMIFNVMAYGDLTATEGLAIDMSSAGAGTDFTVAFDPTELLGSRTWGDASTDTIVWTWNRATGTDLTMTVGNAIVTFNGTVTAGVGFDVTGAADLDIGSADVLDITLVEDGGTYIFNNGFTAIGEDLGSATAEWNDLFLNDGGIIKLGDDQDVTITHVADTGILVNLEVEVDGTLDADGPVTLGDGGDTVIIDSSDWDISATGTITNAEWQGTAIADAYIPDNITIDLASLATTVTVSDDEATADAQEVVFTTDNANLESDGDFTYNPNTGTVTATQFSGGGAALTAIDAATGDSATAFFDAGTIEHEYGGLEDDVSAYNGFVYITGGATSAKTQNAGTDVTADLEEETHASEHGVGGADTVFPADPDADKYLMWDDDPGVFVFGTPAGAGDMTKAVYDSGDSGGVDSITVVDSTYASDYVMLIGTAVGTSNPKTDGALTYDATSGTLAATQFSGGGANLTSIDAATGDSATAFFDAGTIEHEYGGLQADISGYTGLIAITGVDTTAEVDSLDELEAQLADVTLIYSEAIIPVAGTDPDVDATGEFSIDTDGANEPNDVVLRTIDGNGTQVALAQEQKSIQATIIKPNDMADATRDACVIWSNETGMSFVVTKIEAWSDTDDTTLNVEEEDADGANNATIDGLEIATNGTGMYYTTETTITAATVEANHLILLDFDDTDDPGWVKVSICGYFLSDVD